MRQPKGLLMRYLSGIGDVLDRLAREKPARVAPFTSVFLLVLFASCAAFVSPLPFSARSFLPLLLAFSLALLSRELDIFLRATGIALVFLSVVALPLLFITGGEPLYVLELGPLRLVATWDGLWRAVEFVLRCLNAISLAVAWTTYVGFTTLIKGLHVLDPTGTIPNMAFLTVRYVPLSIREGQRLLAAREARMLKKPRLRSSWLILASCCGDLLLRTFNRAWRVGMAMRSRSFSDQPVRPRRLRECFRLGVLDAAWLLLATAFVLIYVVRVV